MRGADMGREERDRIAGQLQRVPAGEVAVARHAPSGQGHGLLTDRLSVKTEGRGQIQAYTVFPGIDVSYLLFQGSEIAVRHEASPSVLELFYCRSGRVGWNMRGGLAVYLGAGDLTAHSAVCCADSAMMFPLGYGEGLSFSMNLPVLEEHCPEILREADVDFGKMQSAFCTGKPVVLPAGPALEGIFAPLYAVSPHRRGPYLRLKVQELLLYLTDTHPETRPPAPYFSQQTELIKEIHRQLTEHLDRRFTIEELSRQYLINTSTLKEVFKAVYGLPIATYMKEYRVRQAMELLRNTDATVAEIAGQVGYESQGKFSKAFQDVTRMLPTEYRRSLSREADQSNFRS